MKSARRIAKIVNTFTRYPFCYLINLLKFSILNVRHGDTTSGRRRFAFRLRPIISDAIPTTSFDRHYVYHVAWALRKLLALKPEKHHDFGSSLYFVTAASAHTEVVFHDIRPPSIELDNLELRKSNLCKLGLSSPAYESISCMHVLEHIGLGRYGDDLDVDGDLKAAAALSDILAPKGTLLIVVPVGRPTIFYNAHRVYSYEQVVSMFPNLSMVEFSLIEEDGVNGIIEHCNPNIVHKHTYACGLFHFKKL